MKSKITKFLALVMAVAIVFSLAACGKDEEKETTTVAGETTTLKDEITVVDETTAFAEETTVVGDTTAVGATTVAGQTTTAAVVNTIPTTKEEILKAYTDTLNQAKKTDRPGFYAIEYQALPKEEQKIGGAVKYILPIAEGFMTKEDQARKEPRTVTKGSADMTALPVKESTEGCYITNVSAIKTAKCEKLANGNYKITIVLNDELNPEPYEKGQAKAPSNHGGMFQPLGKKSIDNELNNNSTVKNVIKSATYSLNYYDCNSVLEYNPANGHIVTLDQKTNALITMEGTIIILGKSSGTAVLEMYYKFYDFKY